MAFNPFKPSQKTLENPLDFLLDLSQCYPRIAGVDEAGRGPLAGPVYAAAVILDPNQPIEGLADSKTLSESKREFLAKKIYSQSIACAVASASVEEIDQLNILQATLLAMQRAVEQLRPQADYALIDGNQMPRLTCPGQSLIKGDALVAAISAASILAKTARDQELKLLHEKYPEYGFNRHKGYGTALHREKIKELGPCTAHRRSFAPVRESLQQTPYIHS